MVELKVKCSSCGEEVVTGMEMEEDQFEKALLKGSTTERSSCGEEISWGKGDVINKDQL